MASGLQCPGCGHVHPGGLPEIARGDSVFRCYGCYRPLSIPEGWTGRASPRPGPELNPTDDAPPGAGSRDARSARLAARRGVTMTRPPGSSAGMATQASPLVTSAGSPTGTGPTTTGPTTTGPATAGPASAGAGTAGPGAARPIGWVAPRRSGDPVPAPVRLAVWTAAFGLGLMVSAFVLRKVGVLDVDAVIDLYAGTGPSRFGILLVLLPLWAVVAAAVAHLSIEALARRRRPRRRSAARTTVGRSPSG